MQSVRTNLKINASTQYTNFNYNSLCRFNGVTLGAGATGFFKACCGADDNGTAIAAYFVPHMTEFGSRKKKRTGYAYLGWQCSGDMTLALTGDEQTTIGPYTVSALAGKGQHVSRVKIGMGLAWTYASFKFSNVSGSDFSIDSVQILGVDGKTTPLLTGSSGLNNIVDPVRLRYDPDSGIAELAEAVNVDIDDTGRISRRPGQSLLSAGVFQSVFCYKADCFVVQDREADAALYKVGTDYSLVGVRSGLTRGARISFCQVGGKTYYANYYQNGVIEDGISAPWPVNAPHVGADTVRAFYPAPIGQHLAFFQSSMWVARDNVIWVSEPNAFGKFDMARRFFQFGSNVRMMKPVKGGVWVSDCEKTAFISAGMKFDDMEYTKKSPFPAHEWSDNIELVDLSQTALEIQGLSAVWSSDAGLCIGSADGQLTVVTEKKLLYPTGAMGATVVDGTNVINSIY